MVCVCRQWRRRSDGALTDDMGCLMGFRYGLHLSWWWVDCGFMDDLGCLMGFVYTM